MKCDVLVVGAGPAGSMAAKTAAENGIDVILIERNKNIGYPVRCAEGINKFLFDDTGIKKDKSFIEKKIDGTKIYFYDEAYELNSEQWQGYTVDRTVFDKYLAKQAENAGSKIFTETKAIGVKQNGNKWIVGLNSKKDIKNIEAKAIIGADGFESNVGKWVKIKNRWKQDEICKCYELFLSCPNLTEENKFHIAFGEEFSMGYAWIFPKNKKANVGVGVFPKVNAIDALNFYITQYGQVNDLLGKNYSVIEKRGGCIPMSGPRDIDEAVSDGVILVGDAAGMVEPITGEGIGPSMISGISAGETVSACIKNDNWNKSELSEYQKRWKNKHYINTTLGESMNSLLEMKETFHTIFSKKSTQKEREEFICMISDIT